MSDPAPTVEVECPVCSAAVDFPPYNHARAGEPLCEDCECIGEDEERNCWQCGARIVWHLDDYGYAFVDDDDPAWTTWEDA